MHRWANTGETCHILDGVHTSYSRCTRCHVCMCAYMCMGGLHARVSAGRYVGVRTQVASLSPSIRFSVSLFISRARVCSLSISISFPLFTHPHTQTHTIHTVPYTEDGARRVQGVGLAAGGFAGMFDAISFCCFAGLCAGAVSWLSVCFFVGLSRIFDVSRSPSSSFLHASPLFTLHPSLPCKPDSSTWKVIPCWIRARRCKI